ncbi:carbonic anhydrase-related protein A [Lycorma delicatula]|uniref:carbonic anhydrase-related protein A n=1 Tax=Lycorma delicatula TaxID=130591 RepID=UPI003F50F1CE
MINSDTSSSEIRASWEEWWTYDGISGPEYWGRINPEWSLCNKGRRQSPINVDPQLLLFDPYLEHINIDKCKVNGILLNTGQSLVFRVDKDLKHHVNISGGPLAYRYQFEELYIHYGTVDQVGSEHKIGGQSFPAEIQLYGFNAELYHNMTEAQHKSQGIVGISLMVQIGEKPNREFQIITSTFRKVQWKGEQIPIKHLSLTSILPDTSHYMTYEGSTTHPGCWETTVWIILNKPIYMTKQELYYLRTLQQGSQEIPKAPLGNNARPPQPLYHRTVRTNIDFQVSEDYSLSKNNCPITMHKEMYYKANKWRQSNELFQV